MHVYGLFFFFPLLFLLLLVLVLLSISGLFIFVTIFPAGIRIEESKRVVREIRLHETSAAEREKQRGRFCSSSDSISQSQRRENPVSLFLFLLHQSGHSSVSKCLTLLSRTAGHKLVCLRGCRRAVFHSSHRSRTRMVGARREKRPTGSRKDDEDEQIEEKRSG